MNLSLTDSATVEVKKFMEAEGVNGVSGLRVRVVPGGCSGFQYAMNIEEAPAETDEVVEAGGLRVFVDMFSAQYLDNVQIDYVTSVMGSGFTFNNPNASGGCGCGILLYSLAHANVVPPSGGTLSTGLNAGFNNFIGATSMSTLTGSKTHDNLKNAFAGESQANRRYLYFARQADVEGYPDIAGLFRDTAEGETGHAHGHMDFLKEIGDPATGEPFGTTTSNLKAAIAGETYEYTEMYPGFARTAREEGFEEIAEWFETLARAEKSHAGRFQKGLDTLA